jgi:hypothetical protein
VRERAQAARLLHRRHLFVAGRLALRHVVLVVDIEGGFLRNHARCRETRRSTIGMESWPWCKGEVRRVRRG